MEGRHISTGIRNLGEEAGSFSRQVGAALTLLITLLSTVTPLTLH